MRWAGYVARIGEGEVHTRFRCRNQRKKDNLEDLNVDGKIILKWIFKNSVEKVWTGMV